MFGPNIDNIFFSDNLVYDNKEVIKSTVESGCCLFTVSGNICYPMHDFYRSVTMYIPSFTTKKPEWIKICSHPNIRRQTQSL